MHQVTSPSSSGVQDSLLEPGVVEAGVPVEALASWACGESQNSMKYLERQSLDWHCIRTFKSYGSRKI